MTSQQVFWASAVIAVLFVVIFLFPRSGAGPARLRLSRGNRSSEKMPTLRNQGTATMSKETRQESAGPVRMKSLNVMFNYNGHSWDAHEVLGVPAGAPMDMVKSGYQQSLKTTDPSSHDFIQTAYDAICSEMKKK